MKSEKRSKEKGPKMDPDRTLKGLLCFILEQIPWCQEYALFIPGFLVPDTQWVLTKCWMNEWMNQQMSEVCDVPGSVSGSDILDFECPRVCVCECACARACVHFLWNRSRTFWRASPAPGTPRGLLIVQRILTTVTPRLPLLFAWGSYLMFRSPHKQVFKALRRTKMV